MHWLCAQCLVRNPAASANGAVAGTPIPPLPQPLSLAPSQFLKVSVLRLGATILFLYCARVTMSCAEKDALPQRPPFQWGMIGQVLDMREGWGGQKCRRPASYSVHVAKGAVPSDSGDHMHPSVHTCIHTHMPKQYDSVVMQVMGMLGQDAFAQSP